MRRLQIALFAAVAVFGLASVASAADMPVKARPMAAPVDDWTGFYFGVNGGYGSGHAGWSDLVSAQGTVPGEFTRDRTKGALAGVQFGYNRQMGQWVFGFATDVDWANVKGTNVCFGPANDRNATCGAQADFLTTSTVRVGYAMGHALPYVKGGWALAHDKFTAVNIIQNGSPTGDPDYLPTKAWRSGLTVGAGLEYAVDMKWSAFVEYDYMDFGKNREGLTPSVVTFITGPWSAEIAQTISVVKFGLNYRY